MAKKNRIEGDAEVTPKDDGEKPAKGKAKKQRQLFTMTAEERAKAMTTARAELLVKREAFERLDDQLATLKRSHKTAEDAYEGAKDRIIAIALDEAAP